MATALAQVQKETLESDFGIDCLLHVPRQAHTLAGFRAWALSDEVPEKLRVTFLDGEVYLDMSKEEINTHALLKTEVARVLANLMVENDLGHLFINGVLVTNVPAKVSNNPDAAAVFWTSLEKGLVRYPRRKKNREMEVEGSPDWVLEIVSDSSVTKDTQQLRRAYHRAGIREYWLIDARGPEMSFQVLHWRQKSYVVAAHHEGWVRSRVFDRLFSLTRQTDRRGGWRYTLHVKIT